MANNRSILSEMHQSIFRRPLELSVVSKEGADHYPTIPLKYDTGCGVFTKKGAPGQNQRIVAEELAEEIILQNIGK